MIDLGALALLLAFVQAAYAVGASLYGARVKRLDVVVSAEHALHGVFGCVVIASAVLLYALVTRDFTVEYVASYTSTTLPLRYAVAAFWGGQKGSLLFWVLILTLFASVVHLLNRENNRDLMPYVTATLMTVALFFLTLLVFITNPFERLALPPQEGADLNPLLQNYWMTIHPPSLYLGYVSISVPFAFAIAALATGRLDETWIRTTRRWALCSWFFLTMGNLLGARWAYEVLGWGGYWAWDPVENAAIMPWLTATAYLHSVMIQEKKNMLKVWNMVLILLTFFLTIFGTFVTRSGVISSVHSFTQSGLGPFFLTFLFLVVTASLALLVYRLPLLRSENELDSLVSREASFLFNNLILVGIAFATFWGTVFPIISEAVRGVKITVGPPFFNKVNAPLGIALLFLSGVGPVIAWRRASVKNLRRNFAIPAVAGLVGGGLLALLGVRQYSALTVFSLAFFVLIAILQEFYRGTRARQALVQEKIHQALFRLVEKNTRRYGGYIVHVGVVLIFVGITASSLFRVEKQVTLKTGDIFTVGRYTLRYEGLRATADDHIESQAAVVRILRGGKELGFLYPEKRLYKKQNQPTTEVAIRSTLWEDLYLVLGSHDPPSQLTTLQAFVNPLVMWLWLGGAIMAFGTVIVMLPSYAERRALASLYRPEKIKGEAVTE